LLRNGQLGVFRLLQCLPDYQAEICEAALIYAGKKKDKIKGCFTRIENTEANTAKLRTLGEDLLKQAKKVIDGDGHFYGIDTIKVSHYLKGVCDYLFRKAIVR
jgi:hypothetical protein